MQQRASNSNCSLEAAKTMHNLEVFTLPLLFLRNAKTMTKSTTFKKARKLGGEIKERCSRNRFQKIFKVLPNSSTRDKPQDTKFPEDIPHALILKCLSYFLIRFHLEHYFNVFYFLKNGTKFQMKPNFKNY